MLTSVSVPIYDARREVGFKFTAQNLSCVHGLPRFKKDMKDPEDNKYICTVAYTTNTWKKTWVPSASLPCVSLNIIFVIILGQMRKNPVV